MSSKMTNEQQRHQRKRKAGPKPRHVPLRTCIVCRESRPKRELIRIVRTPDGHVVLDPTGKKSGRGAYLCAKRSCWEPALRKGKLEHEFGVTLTPEDRAELEAYVETLPREDEPAPAKPAKKPRVARAQTPDEPIP
jgi:predicted RNA-binding protein YlxR (DUF448 family)